VARYKRPIRSRAFTLIELLVVIAIIALLMAVFLPSLQRVRNQARAVVCRAHLRQWGQTLSLYVDDHQGRLPRPEYNIFWLLTGRYIGRANPDKPAPYHPIRTEGIACCPMAVKPTNSLYLSQGTSTSNGVTWVVQWKMGKTYQAWEMVKPEPVFRCSFGMNDRLFQPMFEGRRPPVAGMFREYTDVYSVKGRGDVPVLFDTSGPWASLMLEQQAPPLVEETTAQ
jgi:prepilin-type N-terminal cleavage/methylation domain-containing protein